MIPFTNFSSAETRRAFGASLLTLTAIVTGCGSSVPSGDASVAGTITLDGAPLPSGNIVFYDGAASAGIGMIQSDGTYSLNRSANASGMATGSYGVSIESWEVEPNSVSDAGEIIVEGKTRIPEKYNSASTSGLTAEVEAGANDLSFELKSE